MGCLVCQRIDMIRRGENPWFVRELETGYVVVGDHQYFRGYSLFLCKEHARELHDLPPAFRAKHLEEMALVSEAVHKAFGADKMNIESLGNGDAHVHWHLFPRRQGDLPTPGPVWWMDWAKMTAAVPSPAEREELKSLLNAALDRVLSEGDA